MRHPGDRPVDVYASCAGVGWRGWRGWIGWMGWMGGARAGQHARKAGAGNRNATRGGFGTRRLDQKGWLAVHHLAGLAGSKRIVKGSLADCIAALLSLRLFPSPSRPFRRRDFDRPTDRPTAPSKPATDCPTRLRLRLQRLDARGTERKSYPSIRSVRLPVPWREERGEKGCFAEAPLPLAPDDDSRAIYPLERAAIPLPTLPLSLKREVDLFGLARCASNLRPLTSATRCLYLRPSSGVPSVVLTGDSSVSSGSGLLQLARMRIPFLFTGRPDAGMALLACLLACWLGWAGLAGWLAGRSSVWS